MKPPLTGAQVRQLLDRFGTMAGVSGVIITRGQDRRIRWRCSDCGMSGAVAGDQRMVGMVLTAFMRRHRTC